VVRAAEEDFVEFGAARHLLDRAHFDGGVLHVDPEHGEALVLRHIRIGADEQDAVVAEMGAGRPDLLAVDDPVVAILLGFRAQARDVGTAGGLGEELAPDLVAAHGGTDETLLRLIRAPGHDGRDAHAEPDGEDAAGDGVFRFFLTVDNVVDGGAATAAPLLRPGDAGVTGIGLLRLPGF